MHHDDTHSMSVCFTLKVYCLYPVPTSIYTAVVVLVPDSKIITPDFCSSCQHGAPVHPNGPHGKFRLEAMGTLFLDKTKTFILIKKNIYEHVFVSSLRSVGVSYPGALPIPRSSCIPLCSIYVPMHSICVPLLSI
jgi:hypothetical protein